MKFPHVSPEFCEKICGMAEQLAYDVEGVVSVSAKEKLNSIKGYRVYSLKEVFDLSWDAAVLACNEENFDDFVSRMVDLKIGTAEQFKNCFWLLKQLMIKKYEDCADPAIQETIEYWKTDDLSIFNQHIPLDRGTFDKIFFDETCDLVYIQFKTVGGEHRKMYFPPEDEKIITFKGEKVLANLLFEQYPTSPHLYTKDEHDVHAGDILIDAGVAEGNFALKYVDICSKMYLFEPESKWIEALKHTFKDYRDKVEIIPKFVSDITDGENITIDDALPNLRGKNIFLKMDVEGSEPNALRGAKNLLTNNSVRASVCTYHNAGDLVKVKSLLQKYGYETSTSDGYMVFTINPNIFDTADFRKGIVYAKNF